MASELERAPAGDAAREGTVFDIKRYSVHDGPGLRTTVFLKGCSLACAWCHNPESISARPELAFYPQRCIGCGACVDACPNGAHRIGDDGAHVLVRDLCQRCGRCAEACYAEALVMIGRTRTVGDVLTVLLEDRAFYERSGGGITLSGGEPFVQPQFTAALLRACKAEGLHTAVDTAGHVPWATIEEALPHIDLVLYDLKHADPQQHHRYTGAPNDRALANLRRVSEAGAAIEVRMPIIPDVNDDDAALDAAARLLGSLRALLGVRLLAYHRLAGSKYASIGRDNTMPRGDEPTRVRLEAVAARLRQGMAAPVVVGSDAMYGRSAP
jgi:pyruvate formate lyase activating enzyme